MDPDSPPSALQPTLIELSDRTVRAFLNHFDRPATAIAAAPGRVNIIGEHVDYNGGWVLPAAIERWIVAAAAPRRDGVVALHDARTGETTSFLATELDRTPQRSWSNYVRGVLAGFSRLGHTVPGFSLTLCSTIPMGGGLSSSAALEAVTAKTLCQLFGWKVAPLLLAKLCQTAEHEYAGMPCGLMDQAAVILSRDQHLLLMDCATEKVEFVPFADPDWRIMIINSGVAHQLADGEYAKRRASCHQAASALGVKSLRELDPSSLAEAGRTLNDEMTRCVRHVLTENQRTCDAVSALGRGDLPQLGRLLNASHASLRDDYRVSCAELDLIAVTAQLIDGVAGCRMTGGGFGGSAVALVHVTAIETASIAIEVAFSKQYGHSPGIFVTRPVAGASAWSFFQEAQS